MQRPSDEHARSPSFEPAATEDLARQSLDGRGRIRLGEPF